MATWRGIRPGLIGIPMSGRRFSWWPMEVAQDPSDEVGRGPNGLPQCAEQYLSWRDDDQCRHFGGSGRYCKGTPFGTGAITLNPGGSVLRLGSAANITSNAVTVNSDMSGVGVISLIYGGGNVGTNGGLTGITFKNATFGGPFSAVLGIDSVGYSSAINLNTFGGGTAFLGSVLGGNFTGTLTPRVSRPGEFGPEPETGSLRYGKRRRLQPPALSCLRLGTESCQAPVLGVRTPVKLPPRADPRKARPAPNELRLISPL